MSSTIVIAGKQLGSKKSLFPDWSISYPPDLQPDGEPVTLRALISRIVRAELDAFRRRQDECKVIRALTARQVANGAAKGKIISGGIDLEQEVDEDTAVHTALQAFEDGLYLVSVDDAPERDLDREVFLRPDSRVTFVRLVMLAAG